MRHQKRILGLMIGALAVMPMVASAQAESYPSRPITLIIPFPAGGTTDVVGRIVAERLTAELGQTVVAENRGGAGGSIGSNAIAKAKPDGYTLGIATVSTHGINPAVYKKLPFDAKKDFTPITNVAAVPNIVTVNPKVKAQNMQEFVALAKAEPGALSYASAGHGSVANMMGELFKMASKTDLLHVPYRGSGPALTDTLAGQVDTFFDNLPTSLPHVKSGKLRALAVAWPQRVTALPDVPTFAEVGLPEVNDASWFGLIAPAGLPADILEKLNAATVKVLKSPEVIERLASLGAAPIGNTPAEFAKQISDRIDQSAVVAKQAGISID